PLKVSASQIRNETEDATTETAYTQELFVTDDETADKDSAFIGSAYHRVFESITLDESVTQIKEKINELAIKGEFSESVAEKISAEKIFEGINNQELKKLLDGEIYHEIPFMLKVPYKEIVTQYDGNEETVLQGVIDMLVLGKNSVKIIDYKYTSRPDYIVKNYSPQLNAYALAAEKIFGLKAEAYVLSIKDNRLIKIK
ncbi:MAG: PD-(D/E)XK nuclease family protein, partial [Clostridia bacterium]|nr:PD-(D/E)XK nuclease family protein [Clostridia bacterium]